MKGPLRWLGYLAVFGVGLVLLLYWTFPYDALRGRIVTGLEQQLGSQWHVTMASLEPHWVTGIKIRDLALARREGEREHLWIAARTVTVRVGPFSLLFGNPTVRFVLHLPHGKMTGEVGRRDETTRVAMQWIGVELQDLGLVEAVTGLKMGGGLEGEVKLLVNPRQIKTMQGTIHFALINWKTLKGSKVTLGGMGEMELDVPYALSKRTGSELTLEFDRGRATIHAIRLQGGDIGVDLSGELFLDQRLAQSRLNLKGQATVSSKLADLIPEPLVGPPSPDTGAYLFELTGRVAQPHGRLGKLTF